MTAGRVPDEWVELRALADKATPGPWEAHGQKVFWSMGPAVQMSVAEARFAEVLPEELRRPPQDPLADAEFIAAARSAVPALLDEVDRLRAERDRAVRDALTGAVERIEALLPSMAEAMIPSHLIRAVVADLRDGAR